MAVLGATTLTGCNSIPDFLPTGSVTSFAQAAAPTSWTRVTDDSANNRMLRVVNTGSGGGTGGSASPILNNVVPAHTHGFTTGGISANHFHGFSTGNVSNDHVHGVTVNGAGGSGPDVPFVTGGSAPYTYNTGGISANHTHSGNTGNVSSDHAHSGTTDNGSSQTNWSPRYIDLLLCSKN